jgi:hypothetical protein
MRALASLLLLAGATSAQALVIDADLHHLGDDRKPEWSEASAEPEGLKLERDFAAHDTGAEQVLALRSAHVDGTWTVLVNGTAVGELPRGEASVLTHLPLAAGVVHEGPNSLGLVPADASDDIVVGDLRLHPVPLRQLLDLRKVRVAVRDDRGRPMPARLAIVDEAGAPAAIWYGTSELTAVREGLVCSGDGLVDFELEPGKWSVHAARGMEWSHASTTVDLSVPDAVGLVGFTLRREVDTSGWIAADTHVHTLSFSGHGDATLDERLVTLAADGVELAVATDHNHHTDYRPEQERLKLSGWYTPVTGNEVTTENGHFNAFPMDPAGKPPEWKLSDWVALVDGIRAAGARVVILNHPRWPDAERGPFGVFGLDPLTGARRGDVPFRFDAVELVNSTNEKEDPAQLLADWFALLDRGEHVVAAGSSDSHTVRDPVGQGRTYVRSASDDPAHLDVPALCDAIREGRSCVSLGILAQLVVEGRYGPGDVAPVGGELRAELRVQAPSWVRPREARIYADGMLLATVPVPDPEGGPTDVRLPLSLHLPGDHDAWLVATVLGDGLDQPWWHSLNGCTFAATNPVRLDVDGDGRCASPRETAASWLPALREGGPSAVRRADAAVLVHLLDQLGARAEDPLVVALLAAAEPEARSRAQAFLARR